MTPKDDEMLQSVADLYAALDPAPDDLADGVLARLAVEGLETEYELLTLVERVDVSAGTRSGPDTETETTATVALEFAGSAYRILVRISTADDVRRLDGWVVPKDIGQKYLDQNPTVPLELGYTVEDKDTPSAFAVAKNNPDLLKKLNDGLAKAIADGSVARIYGQFYKTTPLSKELQQGGPGLPVKNVGA